MDVCWGLPKWHSGKESVCSVGDARRFNPWVGKIPCRRAWQPIPVFLPGESPGWRSLVGYSPWPHKESNTTEHACTASILCFGFLAPRHMGSQLPKQGSHLCPLCWKLTSQPLDQEGIPLLVFLFCSYYWTKNRL